MNADREYTFVKQMIWLLFVVVIFLAMALGYFIYI